MALFSEMMDEAGEKDRMIGRLRAALTECAAPFDSGPTTIQGAAQLIAAEFERRMNIAANTLNDGTRPPPQPTDEQAREG